MKDKDYHYYIAFWEANLPDPPDEFVYNLLITNTGEEVSYYPE